MRSVRFSIAGLMGIVLVTAIGLAALRSPSETWAGVLLLATLAAFCIALVGAFCRTGAERGADGKGIPIYVDPIGLLEADKTMTSTLGNMDVDGVPLRTSLRLCLKQLDLTYSVKDGLLFITSLESHDASLLSAWADAFQVVGHCVLALIAAGLGGLAAPFVCDLARKPAR